MENLAVALCRVSTAQQRVDGNSLESQEKHVYDFAEQHLKCKIEKLWSLDASSRAGKNIKRKDLEEIKQYCKQNKHIKYFIVDKVNRLIRETELFFWYIVELKNLGVRTYFADPNQQILNQDDQVSKFRLMLEAWLAEADNKERANTTLTRMKDRYLSGYRLSSPVQGYKTSLIPGLHEPDPLRFPLLQSIMREIVTGKYTIYQALEKLNQDGYTTPQGKKLRIDKFRKILIDDYYAGFISIKKWSDEKYKSIKGLHKAMITPEEHEILASIVNGKKRVFERKKDNKDFPLGNIGFCECGGKLVGFFHRNSGSWRSPKYRCRVCGRQFHAMTVHESLDKLLSNVRLIKEDEEDFTNSLINAWKEEEFHNLEKLRCLESKLAQLIGERNQIVKKIALNNDPDLEVADLQAVLKLIKEHISSLEKEITEVKKMEKDMDIFIRFALKFIDQKLLAWKLLKRSDRVKCKQLAFPGEIIVNYNEKVCTPQISPIIRFAVNKKEPVLTSDSHLVELRGIAPLSNKSSNNC